MPADADLTRSREWHRYLNQSIECWVPGSGMARWRVAEMVPEQAYEALYHLRVRAEYIEFWYSCAPEGRTSLAAWAAKSGEPGSSLRWLMDTPQCQALLARVGDWRPPPQGYPLPNFLEESDG